jgi:hypothetical protein
VVEQALHLQGQIVVHDGRRSLSPPSHGFFLC